MKQQCQLRCTPHPWVSKAAIFSTSCTDYILKRAYTYVAELNPKIISSLLTEETALIAKVAPALQAPDLPSHSGMTQLIQPFPTFGFSNLNQQFSRVCQLVHIALLQLQCPVELLLYCQKFYMAAAIELHQVERTELKCVCNILCRKGLHQKLEYH